MKKMGILTRLMRKKNQKNTPIETRYLNKQKGRHLEREAGRSAMGNSKSSVMETTRKDKLGQEAVERKSSINNSGGSTEATTIF